MEKYICLKCHEEWEFDETDYDPWDWNTPDTCPLCSMPWLQMLKEVYAVEGLRGALRMAFLRIR